MIDIEQIFIVKNNLNITIYYDGKKLIKPIDEFKDMSENDIKLWFIKNVLGVGVI